MLRARRVLVTVGVAWFLVFASHAGGDQRAHIAELAARHRLPTVALLVDHAQAGALIAYGPSIPDAFRRAATYVDKILKGAKPGDLPVEQPTKFELTINRRTAKALGVAIAPALLARADQVIQ